MHKVIQLISIFLYDKNMFYSVKVHVHWVNLMKNSNHTKNSKSCNFERNGCKAKDSFCEPLSKKMFNGFKMSGFRCKSHV